MRKLLAIGAVVLGGIGVLLCAAAIGLSWWAAVRTVARLDRVAARLDSGLTDIDAQLVRVEVRVKEIREDLGAVGDAAEKMADENPGLPRVQAEIERLLQRLAPTLERADALAESLTVVASGLGLGADLLEQIGLGREATDRVRHAIAKIDRAAISINDLHRKVTDSRAAKAVRLTREIRECTRDAIASFETLVEGIAAARQEIESLRDRVAGCRDKLVSWTYAVGAVITLLWLWIGVGQLCLIGWGRRKLVVSV